MAAAAPARAARPAGAAGADARAPQQQQQQQQRRKDKHAAGAADRARSKGYHLMSTWESSAALSDAQLRAVAAVGACCAPGAAAAADAADAAASGAAGGGDAGEQEGSADVPLLNSHQFYKAHAELEAEVKARSEEKYRSYARDLASYASTIEELKDQTNALLSGFSSLSESHAAASSHASSLAGECERLAGEKARLEAFADAVHAKLRMFDSLDEVSSAFAKASAEANASGSPEPFLPILKSLDEAMEYVRQHAHYKDAGVYTVKFKQLQSRALGLVKTYVTSSLRKAASAAMEAAPAPAAQAEKGAADGSGAEAPGAASEGKGEMAGLYVRFRAAAPALAPLTSELARRAQAALAQEANGGTADLAGATPGGEYGALLADCHATYCARRLELVADTVHRRVRSLATEGGPAHLARAGCAYLAQVCQLERALFEHFFPGGTGAARQRDAGDGGEGAGAGDEAMAVGPGISSLLDPLCGVLYDLLRPMLVHTVELDALCELVDALRVAAAADGGAQDGQAGAKLDPAKLTSVHRVATRAAADAQERLAFRTAAFVRSEIDGYGFSAAELDFPKVLSGANVPAAIVPLERAVRLLGTLYGALETHVFQQLAQEVVAAAVRSAQAATAAVARSAGANDGRLLLVRSLLYLRERIAPFDVDFTSHDAQLDFSNVQSDLRRMLSGQASLAAFTSANALGALLTRSTPKVRDVVVDAKDDVEKRLKAACEQFIMAATKAAVEPVLSFITKVTAVRVSTQPRKPLAEHAFASPEKAKAVVAKARQALLAEVKPMVAAMRAYVPDESTRAALIGPIRSNVLEAHAQLAALVRDEFSEGDAAIIGAMDAAQAESAVEAALRENTTASTAGAAPTAPPAPRAAESPATAIGGDV